MVLLQSYDSPPGLSIESAREAGKGLPGVGRLTDCAKGAPSLTFIQWEQQFPHQQTVPMRASFLEALCLDLRKEIQAGRESIVSVNCAYGTYLSPSWHKRQGYP